MTKVRGLGHDFVQEKYTQATCFFLAPVKYPEIYREFPILPTEKFLLELALKKPILV